MEKNIFGRRKKFENSQTYKRITNNFNEIMNKKEILTSTAKSLFSLIPYAGTAISELVFDYNGRIKQNRLNKFVEILAEGFTNNSEINIDNIQTENFNDLFEAVIKRVFTTKSELKLKRFKDILFKELINPTNDSEVKDIYLDLITNLSEEELYILYEHRHFDKIYNDELAEKNKIQEKLNLARENKKRETIVIGESKFSQIIRTLEAELALINNKHAKFKPFRNSIYYNITEDKFLFYKQRLYSQALLIDSGIGGIGTKAFEIMSITEFGIEFINFIKTPN